MTYVIFARFSSTYAEPKNSHPFKALKMQSVSIVGQRLSLGTCWSHNGIQILRKKRGFSHSTAKENQ